MSLRRRVRLSSKITVFVLLFTLLVNTAFAAPEATRSTIVSLGEFGQDIRFGLLSGNLGAALGALKNPLLLFAGKRAADQPALSRIEIVPGGELRIRQGEPTNFTAFGYSANGRRISGLRFDWSQRNTNGGPGFRNLPDGIFLAKRKGNFIVKASLGGIESQVNLVVEENRPLMMMRKIKEAEANGDLGFVNNLIRLNQYRTGEISSKRDYRGTVTTGIELPEGIAQRRGRGPSADNEESEAVVPAAKSPTLAMMRPADEDGWDNGNWWMADDPGNQTGNPPGGSPDLGAGNGNFQFSAPVVSLPGRGMDLSLSLNYNSRVWSKGNNVMSFDAERGFPAPGWNLGFGKMMFMGTSGGCMLIDADGTNRGYTGTISNYSSGGYSSTNFTGYTTDGSFTDYSCFVSTYNGVTTMSGSSKLPNGTAASYYANSANGKQAFPTQISDAQGNYINITYRNSKGPHIQTITDTMGRVVNFNYDSLDRLISVDVPKMDGAGTRTAVRLHYKQLTLSPGWASGITSDTNNSYPYVIDAIYYPGTGTGYWFNDGDSYSSYGMISKVVEQRGMSWSGSAGDQGTVTAGTMSKQAEYNYTLTPDYTLTDAPTYSTLTESWAGMDTSPPVTSYSVNMNSSPRTIIVTKPNGVKSKQYMYNAAGQWYDGLIHQDETLDASNNQLSKSVVAWGQGAYSSPRPTQTDVTDEKLQVLKTTYTYGSVYNQLISQKKYDYDGITVVHETRNTYENNAAYTGRHIFNLVKTSEVYDGVGAGTRVAKTDYEYDNNAVVNGTGNPNLKAAPNVTMHLSTSDPYTTELMDGACMTGQYNDPQCEYEGQIVYTTPWPTEVYCTFECTEYFQVSVYDPNSLFRGNLTKTTGYSDAAPSTPLGAIAQTKQYDITGNIVSESASCCELKTYDYTLATQYAYPTTLTRGSSDPNSPIRNTTSAVFDFETGLIKQSTDANGKTNYTTYNADSLRPTLTTSSTGAYSTSTYSDSAMSVTNEMREYGGNLTNKAVTYLNGIGKVEREESLGAAGIMDIVETQYTSFGEVWKKSRPYRSGDTIVWREVTYDLLGRTSQVTEPDGSISKAFYNQTPVPAQASSSPGETVKTVDAWGGERWTRKDGLGRLVEVLEPKADGNGAFAASGNSVTTYTYDPLNNLTQAVQGDQNRNFKYDSLGRMTRQKLAEQTATINDAGQYVGAGGSGANWSGPFLTIAVQILFKESIRVA